MRIAEGDDWSDRRFDLSFKTISPWLKTAPRKEMSFGEFAERCGYAMVSSVIGQQLIFLLSENPRGRRNSNVSNGTPTGMVASNLSKTQRPTERSLLLFTGKILADYLSPLMGFNPSEYEKGAWLGLISFGLNRPLDQLQSARREIKLNEGKGISRVEALKVVLRHDGFKGLYKSENILGPSCSAIHRGIYFGLYHKVSQNFHYALPEAVTIPIFSLLASLGASIATFLPDKLRSAYLHIHLQRNTAIQRRGRSLEGLESVTREVLGMLAKGELRITRGDVRIAVGGVLKGFVEMMVFQYAQMGVGWRGEEGNKGE